MVYAGSCGCRMSYKKDLYGCNGFSRGFVKFYSLIGFYDHWLGSMGVQGCGWGLICWKYFHLLEYHNGLPYFKASKVEVGCPSVSSHLDSNLHLECLFSSHLLYDLKFGLWFYDDSMMILWCLMIFRYVSIFFPWISRGSSGRTPRRPGASWRSAAPPAA